MSPGDRVIVSLDFDRPAPARALVTQLGEEAVAYKVGLQLLTASGSEIVRELVSQGKSVFLDLKLLEIPNSVAGAVAAAGDLGASMVTVHALGGAAVLEAAVKAARAYPGLTVLALTVITSLRDADLAQIGIGGTVAGQVARLARLAMCSGCAGVVASSHEAQMLRAGIVASGLIVTPGVHLPGTSKAPDQARTATPLEAIRAGASHVVMGRAIAQASDPQAAFGAACAQVRAACLT